MGATLLLLRFLDALLRLFGVQRFSRRALDKRGPCLRFAYVYMQGVGGPLRRSGRGECGAVFVLASD